MDAYIKPEAGLGTLSQRNRNDALWYDQIKKMVEPTVVAYTVTPKDDFILCTSLTTSVQLPAAARQREIYVIKNYAGGSVTVLPFGTETIFGAASLVISARETKRFKAIKGGYVVL